MGYSHGVGYDFSYFLWVGPGMLLSLLASFLVKSTFAKYARIATSRGRTGSEIASELLHRAGISGVRVERIGGFLSDHYDPGARVLRLSPEVHDGTSIAAAGVAAHEAGHAIQHHVSYPLMGLRQRLIMPARFGSQLSYFVIVGGMMLNFPKLAWVGVILFGAVLLFELVTIPVEINASRRAKDKLVELGIINGQEAKGVASVLHAAAFTYIAAMVTTLLTLLYYVSRLTRRR